MAYSTFAGASPMWTEGGTLPMLVTVTWRVTRWELTDDQRWKLSDVSQHPGGDWHSALTVAREWFLHLRSEVEQGRARINVDPVNMSGDQVPGRLPPQRPTAE